MGTKKVGKRRRGEGHPSIPPVPNSPLQHCTHMTLSAIAVATGRIYAPRAGDAT